MREDETAEYTGQHEDEDITGTPGADRSTFQEEDESILDGELTGSTPRRPPSKIIKAQMASLESPYEAMKREMKGEEDNTSVLEDPEDSTVLFAQRTAQLPDMSMTPRAVLEEQTREMQSVQRHKDPLLHRVLDKNYRVQATPHKPAIRISPLKSDKKKRGASAWGDSPMSSPEMAVPQMRSAAFMSPYKNADARQRFSAANRGPRTPGVSVQTPGTAKKTRNAFAAYDATRDGNDKTPKDRDEIRWDSDEDDVDFYAGMSPPKTIQFALPPSKLLQTPGKSFRDPQDGSMRHVVVHILI